MFGGLFDQLIGVFSCAIMSASAELALLETYLCVAFTSGVNVHDLGDN